MKQNLANARAAGKFAILGNLFVFELMRATIGDENFLPALLEEPDWIRDFCQVYLDFYKRHYEIVFREAGTPDGFFLYEDFGFCNGLFCSPKTLNELIIPYEKALVGFFKDYGLTVILHSCGDVRKAVPLVIEAGFDCLQPMEAKAGCDVLALARTYGNKLAHTRWARQPHGRVFPAVRLRELKGWIVCQRVPFAFNLSEEAVYHQPHKLSLPRPALGAIRSGSPVAHTS